MIDDKNNQENEQRDKYNKQTNLLLAYSILSWPCICLQQDLNNWKRNEMLNR